jgi:hypothetical protein
MDTTTITAVLLGIDCLDVCRKDIYYWTTTKLTYPPAATLSPTTTKANLESSMRV